MENKIISPCISICRTDPITGFCYGCARTNEEKKQWKDESSTNKWKEENLKIVAENNFTATSEGYDYDFFSSAESILKVKLKNHSVAPLKLKYTGEYTFHTEFNYIEIAPRSELEIYVKTVDKLEKLVMPFEVLNYVIGSKKNLKINKNISVQ